MKRLCVGLTFALIGAASCGGAEELSLDSAESSEAGDGLRELRDRQLLRGTLGGQPFEGDEYFGHLSILSLYECFDREIDLGTTCGTFGACATGSCGCEEVACDLRVRNCQINLLMDIARSDDVTTIDQGFMDLAPLFGTETDVMTLGPQEKVVDAAIHELVLQLAAEAAEFAELASAGLSATSPTCSDNYPAESGTSDTLTNAAGIPALLGELHELAEEAALSATEDYLAVADAEFSRRATTSDGARGAREVRLLAANLLVGGGGHSISPAEALLCTQPDLDASATEAMRLLRVAGLPPSAVVDESLSTRDLLFRDSGVNLKERLAHVWQQQDLILGSMGMGGMTDEEFLASLGLTEQDFEEARQRMVEETYVFARSQSMVLDTTSDPNDGNRYAATSTPPTTPSWLLYSAFVSQVDDLGTAADRREFRRNQGALRETLLSLREAAATLAGSTNADVAAGADRLQQRIDEEAVGRVEVRREINDDGSVAFHTFGDIDEADVRLVRSPDALTCITTGVIEGIPCDWTSHVASDLVAGTLGVDSVTFAWTPGGSNYYLVRRRVGATSDTPGSYKELVGGALPASSTAVVTDEYLVVPELSRQAGRIMTPSLDWCVRPAESCGAFEFGGRLPLEDELTDDGDAFESSWRRYLNLARQAANEADVLGEEALNGSFDLTLRSEEAINELEDICGVSLNIDPLSAELVANPSGDPIEVLATLIDDDATLAALERGSGDQSQGSRNLAGGLQHAS